MPCRAHAVLCRGLENSLSERHVRSTAWARHGHGMLCVNVSQIRRYTNSSPGSPTGPQWRDLPVSRTFFYLSIGLPSKQGLLIKQNLAILSKSPVKLRPLHVLPTGPVVEKDARFLEPTVCSFIRISQSSQLRSSPTKQVENV